jgi:hypothetical protein
MSILVEAIAAVEREYIQNTPVWVASGDRVVGIGVGVGGGSNESEESI